MTKRAAAGLVEPGWEAVRDAFQAAVADDTETGAGLSIRWKGELVVDLAAGIAQPESARSWEAGTPSVIFSCTKGIMSILLARLVQEGRLDYGARVADYWPEFAENGKADVLVADAVAHRAGLSAPTRAWALADVLDWDRATGLLAAQAPLWSPGRAWSYHAITHGWLTGELVRRITGLMPGEYLEQLITGPLQLDAWIGLPGPRVGAVADMAVGRTLADLSAQQRADAESGVSVWPYRALTLGGALPVELVGPGIGFNRADVQRAQIPGAGGISTAHALATIWSTAVTETRGLRVLDRATAEQAIAVRSEGAPHFPVPGPWPRWGMGFQIDSAARRYLGPSSFGHDGAGGQVAFGDLESEIGFAFLTNRMEAGDGRATGIIDAVRSVLAG
jgi:CubicO group peptidase (beta-lactamase class C family)